MGSRERKGNDRCPAIEVELQGNETIAEYINEINITKKEWTTPDYVRGAANINPDSEFLQRYNELIKSEKNPDGYPISTLNLIFVAIITPYQSLTSLYYALGRMRKERR